MKPNCPVLKKADYEVKTVSLATCQAMVEKYHYAKTGSNTATFRHGLFLKALPETCLGIAWWIPPTKSAALANYPTNWKAVLVLSRLVVHPDVPQNAASFLIMQSVKLIRKDLRWEYLSRILRIKSNSWTLRLLFLSRQSQDNARRRSLS